MKTRFVALFVTLYFLFFNGCATTPLPPLKIETDGPKLAEIVGIDPSEVKFLSHCRFVETTRTEATAPGPPQYPTVPAPEGVVLLTETHLYILRDGSNAASSSDQTRVPFSDLSAVTLQLFRDMWGKIISYQLQFLRGEQVLVVQIRPNGEVPFEETQRPIDLVLASGVPEWESKKFFILVKPPYPAGVRFVGEMVGQGCASLPLLLLW